MKSKSKRIAASIVLVLLSLAPPSYSQWAVLDLSNLIQNLYQVAHEAQVEINTYTVRMNQLIQLKNEAQNLKQMGAIGAAARLGDLQNEYRALEELRVSSKNLRSAINGEKDLVLGINRMINISGLTPQKWVDREKQLAKQEDANAKYLIKASEDSVRAVEEAQKQREKVLSENNYDEGIRAVAMKTNVLLGNLGSVQSQTLLQLTTDSQSRAADMKAKDAELRAKQREAREFANERIRKQESVGNTSNLQ